MAYVNLWQLITTVASTDKPDAKKCQEIQEICGRTHKFVTELSLEVNEQGDWKVKLFDHENPEFYVELTITPQGKVKLTRNRLIDDMVENRTVEF